VILLDTNVVSAVMQKHPEPAVLQWLNDQSSAEIWLPSVVVFELRYGAAIHPDPGRRRLLQDGVQALLDQLIQERVASMDALAAQRAALLAAARRAKGRVVDLRDTLIAGIALACEAQLATRNVRHFEDTTISLINPFQ
jgi:predicted nucleic acid-binding protein